MLTDAALDFSSPGAPVYYSLHRREGLTYLRVARGAALLAVCFYGSGGYSFELHTSEPGVGPMRGGDSTEARIRFVMGRWAAAQLFQDASAGEELVENAIALVLAVHKLERDEPLAPAAGGVGSHLRAVKNLEPSWRRLAPRPPKR